MTVQVVVILLSILFVALAWLHYRVNKLYSYLNVASKTSYMNYLAMIGLIGTLLDKKIITKEDIEGTGGEALNTATKTIS